MPPRKKRGKSGEKKHYPKHDPKCRLCGRDFHPEERPRHVWRGEFFYTFVCGHCAPEFYFDEELRDADDA